MTYALILGLSPCHLAPEYISSPPLPACFSLCKAYLDYRLYLVLICSLVQVPPPCYLAPEYISSLLLLACLSWSRGCLSCEKPNVVCLYLPCYLLLRGPIMLYAKWAAAIRATSASHLY